MNIKNILILNGSPRKKGTSFSFTRTLKILAEKEGCNAQIVHVIDYFDGREELENLRELIAKSDIIGLTAPLYSDALPYVDIWMLEKLADTCAKELRGKSFFAIGQCGFPDITRIEPLLEECSFFAGETGMNWLGGLAYGGGSMINGANMEDLKKKGEKITKGFKLAIDNIIRGEKIPTGAQDLITVKIPSLMYRPLAALLNSMTKKRARESGNIDYKVKAYL